MVLLFHLYFLPDLLKSKKEKEKEKENIPFYFEYGTFIRGVFTLTCVFGPLHHKISIKVGQAHAGLGQAASSFNEPGVFRWVKSSVPNLKTMSLAVMFRGCRRIADDVGTMGHF
jgi:hypothetical protein